MELLHIGLSSIGLTFVIVLQKMNMMHIMEITGQLPDTHLHCAQLAETTLQLAVKEYLKTLGTRT